MITASSTDELPKADAQGGGENAVVEILRGGEKRRPKVRTITKRTKILFGVGVCFLVFSHLVS